MTIYSHDPETWPGDFRSRFVRLMFDRITRRYDLLNRLLSLGMDLRWRRRAAKALPQFARSIVDVGAGTGDLALAALKEAPNLKAVCVDFSGNMLRRADQKAGRAGLAGSLVCLVGDALNLPLADASVDAAVTAFTLRNIPERRRALEEMRRAVKPRGTVLVLEFIYPTFPVILLLVGWYLHWVVPAIGRIVSGDKEAYRYLPASIRHFLTREALVSLFTECGYTNVHSRLMAFGLVCLCVGTR